MEFERAAELRDRILALKDVELGLPARAAGMKGVLGSGRWPAPPGRRSRAPGVPQRRRRRR